jgi:drug/metabolite transporter (DMT)-like permease
MGPAAPPLSAAQGRLCVVLAAVLWSTSGAFTKVLREDTRFGLNEPPLPPLQIAFFRALFAAAVLLPLLRPRDLSFRPALLATGACFAARNALFVSAMALGPAANAILLQYTAPLWILPSGYPPGPSSSQVCFPSFFPRIFLGAGRRVG